MEQEWLTEDQLAAWVRLAALVELLPGVLDTQLRRDADLTNFEYYVLAMLSESPRRTLRMTGSRHRPTPPCRVSPTWCNGWRHRGLVDRFPCPQDRRATNARLTDAGWSKVQQSAPGHVANVRRHVMDALTPDQVAQLADITEAILQRLDPHGTMTAMYHRHDASDTA